MRQANDAQTWPALGDMPPEEFRAALQRVADWVADYREGIESFRVSPSLAPGEITARLPNAPPADPAPFSQIFQEFQDDILPGIVHWGHPAFLGYFGSTTTAAGILGELLAAALNVSAMTWRTSPSATELETAVLDWLRELVGLPDEFTGVVYDTASVAVLHALAAARESLGLDARRLGLCGRSELPVLRIYASDQAHSSTEKAAITLGLGELNVRRVPSDSAYRMDPAALRELIEDDVRGGRLPLAVVATVGTTSTASIDAVDEIASICRKHRLWLHVDAAYGGAVGLLPELRHLMNGIEAADSVVVNAHKWLFVPLDFSALYVRHSELLRATFSVQSEYLSGDAQHAGRNYMDYGIQLGRRFRALKAWMVIRSFGSRGLAARIREHIRLAQLFASWVDADPQFEVLAPVTMAVICFRYVPLSPEGARAPEEELNRLNERLAEAATKTGEAYLTHTTLKGKIAVRLAVGNVLTSERHLRSVYDLLSREAARLNLATEG
jgi:aromatic-L-amino-acid decarboxylase